MMVRDVYRPGVSTASITDSLVEIAARMEDRDIGALAVLDGGRLVGIITERDVLRSVAQGADPRSSTVALFMSPRPEVAGLDEDTGEVAARMLGAGIRHLPVVEGDEVVGMVSIRGVLAVESWHPR